MNKFAIVFSMLSIFGGLTSSAQESSLKCSDRTKIDSGFYAVISADRKSAVLSEQTIRGPQQIADLVCFDAFDHVPHVPGSADMMETVLFCSEPNLRDAGYSLRLMEGGFWFHRIAIIEEISFFGSEVVGNLFCNE